MAGIIKNQILKHLSRYVKDLSSDRINVSTLKGEGELTNLELDQETLTELLALPIWMKIKMAHCNRARIMIQWTKLKSTPIKLLLDTVSIQVEACETLRSIGHSASGQANLAPTGKYGFVNKVVDGITVIVDSVEIRFFSKAFESKVQISRIRVESRSPQWKKVDLTHTRLKDVEKGEVLTFKEIEWQTLRLEAQSTSDRHLAPLRLLTNQARARVVLKKRISDCNVVGCRLSLILDDLLWVLTDSQILAATHFMSSLSGLVKQATETSQHEKAARKLESLPEYQAQQNQAASSARVKQSDSARIFDAFDVKETSYHLMCEKIDLHFCDDPGDGRSSHPDLQGGAAAQVQLTQFMIDFYPYHLAKADRRYWPKYTDNELSRWLKQSLNTFWGELMEVFCPKSSRGSCHSLNSQNLQSDRKNSEPIRPTAEETIGARLSQQVSKLMSTCVILKIRDVCLYKVTTSSREVLVPFLSSYIDRPTDISSIHMELTWFYYPGGVCFPLPSPKLYTQIHPLQLHLDVCTVLWLNSFVTNLQNCLPAPETIDEPGYMDIRVEIIMPKVVFEDKASHQAQKDRPQSLQVQAARVIISNFRSSETGTIEQLAESLRILENLGSNTTEKSAHNAHLVPSKFRLHSMGQDKMFKEKKVNCSSFQDAIPHLTTNMLWTEPRDVWFISVDPVWAEFCVELNVNGENMLDRGKKIRSPIKNYHAESSMHPFIDCMPLQLWMYVDPNNSELVKNELSIRKKNIQAVLHVDRICNVQLTHLNYLSLMRFVEAISEISIFLTIDTRKTFQLPVHDDSVKVIGCLPRLEVSLIMSVSSAVPDNHRDDASIFEPESTFPEQLNCEKEDERQERTKEWSFRDEQKSQFYHASVPESSKSLEEPHFPAHRASSPTVPSMDSIKASIASGIKQANSSLVVSFSKGGGQSTPDSEVTSMWSTPDSSENNFVHLDSPENDVQEKLDREENVEVAEEVVEEYSTGGSFCVPNQYAKEDTDVDILTICLSGIRLEQNSEGLESSVSLSCRSLEVRELISVPLSDFQTSFSTRSKKWKERCNKSDGITKTDVGSQNNAINLQFAQRIDENKFRECLSSSEMLEAVSRLKNEKCPRINLLEKPGPNSPIREAITKSTFPHLEAEVDLQSSKEEFITVHVSTLKGLGVFLEDEIPPALFPVQVEAVGVNVEIIGDNPSFNNSSTKICLPNGISVARDCNGVLTIGCEERANVKSNENQYQSARDGTGIISQLIEFKNHNEEQEHQLNEVKDLRQTIIDLKREVSTLRDEKLQLLNELQNEKKQKRIITES